MWKMSDCCYLPPWENHGHAKCCLFITSAGQITNDEFYWSADHDFCSGLGV